MTANLPFTLPNITENDYIQYESKFNLLVKFFNYFFFGNGEYIAVPIIWTLVYIICQICSNTLITFNITLTGIVYPISTAVELVANVFFGYYFCKHHILARTILYYKQQYDLNMSLAEKSFNAMSLVAGLGMFCVLALYIAAFAILIGFSGSADDDKINLTAGFSTVSNFIVIFIVVGASLYLCILWCIQVWIVYNCINTFFHETIVLNNSNSNSNNNSGKHNRHQSRTNSTTSNPLLSVRLRNVDNGITNVNTEETSLHKDLTSLEPTHHIYPQQVIEKTIVKFLHDMKAISNVWYLNHIIRTISGVLIVTEFSIMFYTAYMNSSIYDIFVFGIISISYYFTIWITAFSTGITNDRFFEFIVHRLSCLYAEHDQENDALDKQISRSISKIVALRTGEGMHFGGVVMTTEKALTVGSVVGSIIVYAIQMSVGDTAATSSSSS